MKRRAFMHLDGDAFFASVEAAMDPSLRGRPVVTGHERGIASAMSYEAKALGITRATPIYEIRKKWPQVVVVRSSYDAYAIYSKRMLEIVRRYAPVEPYSIDECFADLSAFYHEEYEELRPLLSRMKRDIQVELGITVSLGVGPTKVLAKTASKMQKPDGLTILDPTRIADYLREITIESVWGIGAATSIELKGKGIRTALDFISRDLAWLRAFAAKPLIEIWHELRGDPMRAPRADDGAGDIPGSISRTRSFAPASADSAYIFSELSKNIELAAESAREKRLFAREAHLFIKTKDFRYTRRTVHFRFATADPLLVIREARREFRTMFVPGASYRATGITLSGLVPQDLAPDDLFGETAARACGQDVFQAADTINRRYGRGAIHVASSHEAQEKERREDRRTRKPYEPDLPRPLSVPFLGFVE